MARTLKDLVRDAGADITPQDHVRFKQLLASKPVTALRRFRECQVFCLSQLPSYRELCAEQPQVAERICNVAALMGIPESPK